MAQGPQQGSEQQDETMQQGGLKTFSFSRLVLTYAWWILGMAVLVKVGSYFIGPQPAATVPGHIGALLRKVIIHLVTLGCISFIACLFTRQKRKVFTVAFMTLFAAASLLALPTALIKRYIRDQARLAASTIPGYSVAQGGSKNLAQPSASKSDSSGPYAGYFEPGSGWAKLERRLKPVSAKLLKDKYRLVFNPEYQKFYAETSFDAAAAQIFMDTLERSTVRVVMEKFVADVADPIGLAFPEFRERGNRDLIVAFMCDLGESSELIAIWANSTLLFTDELTREGYEQLGLTNRSE